MRDAAVDVARAVLVYTSVLGATAGAAACAWLRWVARGATCVEPSRPITLDGVPRLVAPYLFQPAAAPAESSPGPLCGAVERSGLVGSSR